MTGVLVSLRHIAAPVKQRRRGHGRRWVRSAIGIVVIVVFVAPYLIMLSTSLKGRYETLTVPPTYLPKTWVPQNYITMWSASQTPLLDNLISTLVIAVGATALTFVVCVPAAYYTAKFRFPGRMTFLFLVVVTQMIQPTLLATGLFRQFSVLGLADNWIAMILINSAFNLTFAIWIMHSFFAGIPKEVNEAAQLDGAGSWQLLTKVDLPLVRPGIVAAVIYTFIASANEFAASLVILTTDTKQPLSVALSKFVGRFDTAWNYLFGVSLVAIIPSLIFFILIEKNLVRGLAAGSSK